jgi:hypothetical protein
MYVYGAYVYTPEKGRCFCAEVIWVVPEINDAAVVY